MVDVALSSDAQRVIDQQISAGEFTSPTEVVEAALRLLDDRDRAYGVWLRAAVGRGQDAIDAGRVIPLTDDFWASLRARVRSKAR